MKDKKLHDRSSNKCNGRNEKANERGMKKKELIKVNSCTQSHLGKGLL